MKTKILVIMLLSVILVTTNCTDSQRLTITVNGVSFDMVYVEGGTFSMGSNDDGDFYEKPVHSVTLSSYHIGKYEVTQKLWKAVMGKNPSYFKGDDLPVECVSWSDANKFIKILNSLTGKNFRLPTEAEWEFAARGGKKSNGYIFSGSDTINDVAWYGMDYIKGSTRPVGTKLPNELGIYDMSGNVWEWCEDWFNKNYYSNSPALNPCNEIKDTCRVYSGGSCSAAVYVVVAPNPSCRVYRGGSWPCDADGCRVAYRCFTYPYHGLNSLGFRLAL